MIVSIGDLHLQSLRAWSVAVGRRVVQDLISSPLNTPENTLVLLGDLTELAVLDGEVFAMLMALFQGMRYRETIILRGNHDGKVDDGRVTATFDFLKTMQLFSTPIRIIEEPAVLSLEGITCLFLPHLFEDGVHSLTQYEAGGAYQGLLASREFDVVFGHFTNTMRSEPGRKYDVEYIRTTHWCFGHNHNPSPGYQGSHIPNTIAEAGKDREVRTYQKTGSTVVQTVLPAPRIFDYYSVRFPEALPITTHEIAAWTIYECEDEAVARQHYGEIYIRRCIYDLTLDSKAYDRQNVAVTLVTGEKVSVAQLFAQWLKTAQLDPLLETETSSYLSLALN